MKALYEKLVAEGWKNLVYLPKTHMFTGDCEGTVDGSHPNEPGHDVDGGRLRRRRNEGAR